MEALDPSRAEISKIKISTRKKNCIFVIWYYILRSFPESDESKCSFHTRVMGGCG